MQNLGIIECFHENIEWLSGTPGVVVTLNGEAAAKCLDCGVVVTLVTEEPATGYAIPAPASKLELPAEEERGTFSEDIWRTTVDSWHEWHPEETDADLLEFDPTGPRIVCTCCGVTYYGPVQEGE